MSSAKLFWTTEKRKVNDLIPFEYNPRKMTEEQVEKLKTSLERFGLVEIPVVDTDNTLVAGHQRMRIMQMLGRGGEEIDVRVPNRKLTDRELREYNVRSNKNTGEWDYDLLASLFELPELVEIGFTAKDLSVFDIEGLEEEKEKKEKLCPHCGEKL